MKGGNRNIQLLVLLFITLVVTFNLRILWTGDDTEKTDWGDMSVETDCEKPVIVSIRDDTAVRPINMSKEYLKWDRLKPGQAKVLAYPRDKESFLTIGVPSIKRVNGNKYLMGTLQSVVEQTSAVEKLHTVVLVLLADQDQHYNQQTAQDISDKYMDLIRMGFIHILQPSKDYYPDFSDLKQNFGDNMDRVRWRSKQVADFAFLFMYARNISQYYIQLEDDVMCAPNFVSSIKKFISYQNDRWAVLEFSELGFIGKLFKTPDLKKLARFMLTFYQEQPVDWLIRYFRLTMTQDRVILRKPTLFQHMGETSSFDISNENKLKDRFFDSGLKKWKSDDPPASLFTSMTAYDMNVPDMCYGSGSGFFWAKDPQIGDTLHIIFNREHRLSRVVVETGNEKMSGDILYNGTIEVSHKLLKQDRDKNIVTCADPILVGWVKNGRGEIADLENKHLRPTKCLIITVSHEQPNWVVFNQVAVFVSKEEGAEGEGT